MDKTMRINTRLPAALAAQVNLVVSEQGLYETSSEYIRDLIRRDLVASYDSEAIDLRENLIKGWSDIAEGRLYQGTGDWRKDLELAKNRDS